MNYELTTVLPGGVTPAKIKAHKADVEELVKTLGGKVAKAQEQSEQPLAYQLRDKSSGKRVTAGVYTNFVLELDPDKAPTVNQKLKLTESIMRHLLVKSE